jgi:hypothetical protein
MVQCICPEPPEESAILIKDNEEFWSISFGWNKELMHTLLSSFTPLSDVNNSQDLIALLKQQI